VLKPVRASGQLDAYGPLHAAHADLLEQAGQADAAAAALARAIETTENGPLRDRLIHHAANRMSG
jgi:RNA polymerase sigma-70 factor (ECF subfamily)